MKHRRHHIKSKVHSLKEKKSIFKRPIFWIVVLFLIIIFLFLYLFLFFSKIQITSVIISGNSSVQSRDIENIVWNNINKNISKSIFLTRPKIITENILNVFPEIESAKVSVKFPETINLEIKERVPFAVFCQTNNEKCFNIDENGIIFNILDKIPYNFSVIRQLTEDKEFFGGEKVIEKNVVDIIYKIIKNLKDNFQIDVKTAMISTPLRLNIETSENWQIYFNLDSETDLQIAKMNLLLKNEISSSSRKTLQYIDLRFKDRAYYK